MFGLYRRKTIEKQVREEFKARLEELESLIQHVIFYDSLDKHDLSLLGWCDSRFDGDWRAMLAKDGKDLDELLSKDESEITSPGLKRIRRMVVYEIATDTKIGGIPKQIGKYRKAIEQTLAGYLQK